MSDRNKNQKNKFFNEERGRKLPETAKTQAPSSVPKKEKDKQ